MANNNCTVLDVQFQDKAAIYNSYMGFVDQKGIFIPCKHEFEMGDQVMLLVILPNHQEKYFIQGKVIWISHGRRQGFGVQFIKTKHSDALNFAMESSITDKIGSVSPNYTM